MSNNTEPGAEIFVNKLMDCMLKDNVVGAKKLILTFLKKINHPYAAAKKVGLSQQALRYVLDGGSPSFNTLFKIVKLHKIYDSYEYI